jgi:dephospho-CoA kinase
MKKVGITGGIGSGKTTVCKIFETLHIPIYYADDRAKWLMVNDLALAKGIKSIFGENAYLPDNTLNRKYISDIVFQNQAKLTALNELVHPAVFEDGEKWFASQKNAPYALKEAALLVESNSYKQLDALIVVTAPLQTRIERVMLRDNAKKEDVEARIAKQMPEEDKLKYADFVIVNDGEKALMSQVMEIDKKLRGENYGKTL